MKWFMIFFVVFFLTYFICKDYIDKIEFQLWLMGSVMYFYGQIEERIKRGR